MDLTTGWYPGVVFVAKSTTKAIFKIVRGTAALSAIFDLRGTPELYAAHHEPGFRLSAMRREDDLLLALAA